MTRRAGPGWNVLAILWGLAAGPAAAGSPPSWVREEAARPAPPCPDHCPAVVLLDRTTVQVGRDLTIETRWQRVVRIMTSDGIGAATFDFMLEPGSDLHDVEAWTLSADGPRGSAGRAQRVESNFTPGEYSDVRRVALSAPGARPGDVVAVEASWNERAPFPLYSWWPQAENLPTRLAELDIALPAGWSASSHGYRLGATLPAEPANRVHLELKDLEALPDEPDRPAMSALLPHVVVRYLGAPGQPDFQRWEGLAAWYAQLARAASASSACPADIASATGGTPVEQLETLARRVQRDVRYVAIELGQRRWEPDLASSTWQRRYGDCKDKAALLVSAIQSIGVEARLLLVCTRSRSDVDPASPDPNQFNHCIVAIAWPGDSVPAAATTRGPSGRPWTIFDPTDTAVPLGFVSDELGGTWGVIADAKEGLIRLPEASPSNFDIAVNGQMNERGDLSARITLAVEGPASAGLLSVFEQTDPAERRARTRAYLAAHWPQAVLDSCWLAAAPAHALRSVLGMDARLPGIARPAGGAWLFSPPLLTAWPGAPPRDSTRRLPVVLGNIGHFEENWEVRLPAGLVAESSPPVAWQGPAAAYTASIAGTPGRIALHRELDLRTRELPPGQYDQARGLLRAIHAGDHPSILLSR